MDLTRENHHIQLPELGRSSRALNSDFATAITCLVFQK